MMPDWLRDSVANGEPLPELGVLVTRVLLSVLCGFIVAGVYALTLGRRRDDVRTLATTLVLLSVLIAIVTLVIGNSVARAFGLVGALSIVRFRTVVEDTRDTAFVIFAVVVGMAVGSQQPWVAVLGLAVGGGASFALAWREGRPPDTGGPPMMLRLRVSLGTELDPLLAQMLGGGRRRMVSMSTAKQGTSFEAAYEIFLSKEKSPEELVKQLHRMEGIHDVRLTVRGEETE